MEHDAWYFAYGSNLFLEQKERRTGPVRKAVPCCLKDYRLAFNKRGSNGAVFANIIPEVTEEVWGVIYLCSPCAFRELDHYEGVSSGHYQQKTVNVVTKGGESITAITYVAGAAHLCVESSPDSNYVERIISGARQHHLPRDYIRSIEFRSGLRPCRDHQRIWRGHCVDKGLKNEWLDQLNSLQSLDLLSICEGHPVGHRRSFRSLPWIRLQMKPELVPDVANHWNQLVSQIVALIHNRETLKDATVAVELRRRVRSRRSAAEAGDDLVIRFNADAASDVGQRDEMVCDWFERVIAAIRQLDVACLDTVD